MIMKRLIVILFVVSLSSTWISCGGGGDDGGTPAIPLKTNVIRSIQPGDTWNYSVTGVFINNSTTVNLNGSVNNQILASTKLDPVTSVNCFDEYSVMNLILSSGPPIVISQHTYISQDSNGSIFIHGLNLGAGDAWVSAPSGGKYLSNQSPVLVGQNYGGSVTLSDGTTVKTSSSVDVIEDVQTNMGKYQAYKMTEDATIKQLNGIWTYQNNTLWYVPGLGTVKVRIDTTTYSGSG